MDCHIVRVHLAGYLDRELVAAEEMAVAQHLAECADCRQVLEQQRAIRKLLHKAAAEHPVPAGLADRIRASLPQPAEPATVPAVVPPAWWRRPWLGLSAAAFGGLAAGVVLTLLLLPAAPQTNLVTDEVVASHVRALMPGHLFDVASTDQHTVKPWFAGRLDFSPPVIDLATAGYPLVGGRLDYLGRRNVAALVYRHRLHVIDLYIWPSEGAAPPAGLQQRQGYQVLAWRQQGMNLWAVSDLNWADLQRFAQLLQQQGAGG